MFGASDLVCFLEVPSPRPQPVAAYGKGTCQKRADPDIISIIQPVAWH